MRLVIIVALASSVICIGAARASAQTWNPPADSQRCPSKWGAGDQRGAANHMKPDTVLRAEMLPDTSEITVADLQQALQRQQLTLQPGDAVILHTGWGRLWGKENERYMRTNPGIDVAASEWLARQDPMLIGADTAPINVTPSPDPKLSNPVHQIALVVNGVFLLENLRLDELASQRAYEFALVVEPLKLVGATGSTVAPIAIR
jgi:kynurenine formamidase